VKALAGGTPQNRINYDANLRALDRNATKPGGQRNAMRTVRPCRRIRLDPKCCASERLKCDVPDNRARRAVSVSA